ncbi:MAG: hypothetical protein V3S05_05285, partial [Desulfobacterales bacterium]
GQDGKPMEVVERATVRVGASEEGLAEGLASRFGGGRTELHRESSSRLHSECSSVTPFFYSRSFEFSPPNGSKLDINSVVLILEVSVAIQKKRLIFTATSSGHGTVHQFINRKHASRGTRVPTKPTDTRR